MKEKEKEEEEEEEEGGCERRSTSAQPIGSSEGTVATRRQPDRSCLSGRSLPERRFRATQASTHLLHPAKYRRQACAAGSALT
jgi:hypothetical protein